MIFSRRMPMLAASVSMSPPPSGPRWTRTSVIPSRSDLEGTPKKPAMPHTQRTIAGISMKMPRTARSARDRDARAGAVQARRVERERERNHRHGDDDEDPDDRAEVAGRVADHPEHDGRRGREHVADEQHQRRDGRGLPGIAGDIDRERQ